MNDNLFYKNKSKIFKKISETVKNGLMRTKVNIPNKKKREKYIILVLYNIFKNWDLTEKSFNLILDLAQINIIKYGNLDDRFLDPLIDILSKVQNEDLKKKYSENSIKRMFYNITNKNQLTYMKYAKNNNIRINPLLREFYKILKIPLFLPLGYDINTIEIYDVQALGDIIRNFDYIVKKYDIEDKNKEKTKRLIKNLLTYTAKNKSNKNEVSYKYFSDNLVYGIGRVYSVGFSIQNLKRDLRSLITKGYYTDIDLVNAHPSILLNLCEKFKIPHKVLKHYVFMRNRIIEYFKKKYNMEKNEIKKLFLVMINGFFEAPNLYEKQFIRTDYMYLMKFSNEIYNIRERLLLKFPKLYKFFILYNQKVKKIKDKEQHKRTTLSFIFTTIENHLLFCMIQFFTLNGLIKKDKPECILMYDGIMIRKTNKVVLSQVLIDCQKFIKKYSNFNIRLSVKPIKSEINLKELDVPLLSERNKDFNKDFFRGLRIPKTNKVWINMNEKPIDFRGSKYITKYLMTKKFFKDFEFKSRFKPTKKYEDKLKPAKDVLTDLVNNYFLDDNLRQLRLLKLVFEKIKPVERKYNAKLIFYGGNLMRLINNNGKKYLSPYANEIIDNIFSRFVKKSDNDFSLMHAPMKDTKKYNKYFAGLYYNSSIILNKIKEEIQKNKEFYLSYYNYSKDKQKRLLNNSFDEIKKIYKNDKYLDLADTEDKIKLQKRGDILLMFNEFIRPLKEDQKFIEYYVRKIKKDEIYNSYNMALEFQDLNTKYLTKFSLLRTKISFGLNVKRRDKIRRKFISGELIDIGIPDVKFSDEWNIYDNKGMKRFLDKFTLEFHNDELDFDYRVYNLEYQVYLLYKLIYMKIKYPWDEAKYKKRIARIFYFELFNELNKYPISVKSLKKIRNNFQKYNTQFLKKITKKNKILEKNYKKLTKINQKNYREYLKTLKYYDGIMDEIITKIIKYFSGKNKLDLKKMFELNIT